MAQKRTWHRRAGGALGQGARGARASKYDGDVHAAW